MIRPLSGILAAEGATIDLLGSARAWWHASAGRPSDPAEKLPRWKGVFVFFL